MDNTPQSAEVPGQQVVSPNSSVDAPSIQTSNAPFVLRFAAFIIDNFLVAIVLAVGSYLANKSTGLVANLSYLTYFIYSAVATGLFGTTIGKRFFFLRVIDAENKKPGFGKAIVRDVIGKILSSIPLSLGYAWAIWDKEKQTWHDKIAATHVVSEKEPGKGRKTLAYIIVLLLPTLAIIGILASALLVAINPAAQIEKARQVQQQNQLR